MRSEVDSTPAISVTRAWARSRITCVSSYESGLEPPWLISCRARMARQTARHPSRPSRSAASMPSVA